MKAYKLTDENGQTRNQTQWSPNVSHSANGEGKELCSDGWMHFYTNPLIAIVMNPRHADFKSPKLWECETSGEHLHEALKSGCKTLTTIKEIPVPKVTSIQRIAFGILCTKEVYKDEAWNEWADKWNEWADKWNEWADKWLSGEDRTEESAKAANYVVNATYYAVRADTNINFVEIAERAMNY